MHNAPLLTRVGVPCMVMIYVNNEPYVPALTQVGLMAQLSHMGVSTSALDFFPALWRELIHHASEIKSKISKARVEKPADPNFLTFIPTHDSSGRVMGGQFQNSLTGWRTPHLRSMTAALMQLSNCVDAGSMVVAHAVWLMKEQVLTCGIELDGLIDPIKPLSEFQRVDYGLAG